MDVEALRLLLDSHALLWWFAGDERLGPQAKSVIENDDTAVYVSAISAYEIEYKHNQGKLDDADGLSGRLTQWMAEQGFLRLNVSIEHALCAARLDGPHRDPWDRIIVVQALLEPLTLVSNEKLFDATGVDRLW